MSERQSSADRSSARLSDRRRLRRRRGVLVFSIIFSVMLGACVYGLWQAPVRISHVTVYGADQSLGEIATTAMRGSYLGIIPRDSTFFFPAESIHVAIKTAHPDIAAVSLFREGLTGLSIKIDYRTPIARWCGAEFQALSTSSPKATLEMRDCYLFDANGLIYTATTTDTVVNPFIVYEPLRNEAGPLGVTLPNAEAFPAAFDFARQLAAFGSPVISIAFRGDEVDDHLASGTRVTYVLAHEQEAYTALVSAHANFNLADGSVEYVDLRFPGKVYMKKK